MNYSTKEKVLTIIAVLMVLVDIGMGILVYVTEKRAAEEQWITSLPMANQHIEWTGAGYGGQGHE